MIPQPEWTPDQVAKLAELWATGLSGSQIAAQLGRTKNAIIGRARRLGLPPRSSPIKRATIKLRPVTKRAPRQTHIPIPDLPLSKTRKCQWLGCSLNHNEPMCGAPAVEGRWFCPIHYARCYLPLAMALKSINAAAKNIGLTGTGKASAQAIGFDQ